MKILIFYTPRSRSTFLAKVLSNKFGLQLINDELTVSRIKNQSFVDYPLLIKKINNSTNVCVKLCANDFVDLQNRCLSEYYKQINFQSFDHIVFMTRQNFVDALVSYAYMDPTDQSSWHRTVNQDKICRMYNISDLKIFYLNRGYFVYNYLKSYIQKIQPHAAYYDYDFDNCELLASQDWDLTPSELKVDIIPNNIPYKTLVENFSMVESRINKIYTKFEHLTIDDFNNKNSFAWKTQL